jgi:lysophospholipase L1-like esterase
VLILLGGNDQLRRIDPERSIDELDRMVQALQGRNLMVAVCDFSPVIGVHREWARSFRDVASRRGCILVSGVADGLYTLDGENQAPDGIHLNAEGQRKMAERIALALAPHLDCDPAAVRARIVAAQGG